MRVYIAAPYGAREQVRGYADGLIKLGVTPTCQWVYGSRPITSGTTGTAPYLSDKDANAYATQDLLDVASSDALVMLTEHASKIAAGGAASGGRHIELGYALALGKRVIVVGLAENIFHRSALTQRVDTWELAVEALALHPTLPLSHASWE